MTNIKGPNPDPNSDPNPTEEPRIVPEGTYYVVVANVEVHQTRMGNPKWTCRVACEEEPRLRLLYLDRYATLSLANSLFRGKLPIPGDDPASGMWLVGHELKVEVKHHTIEGRLVWNARCKGPAK